MTAEMAAGGLALKRGGSGWDRATMAATPSWALVLLAPPHALLANILQGRRDKARKMLSHGNDDDDGGAIYGGTAKPTSWF
jgi:hypothetical protein